MNYRLLNWIYVREYIIHQEMFNMAGMQLPNYLKGDDVVAPTAEAPVAETPKPVAKAKGKASEGEG